MDAAALPQVTVHGLWPVLSAGCGVLVLAAGAMAVRWGQTWTAMSARYEPAAEGTHASDGDHGSADQGQAASSTALWSALDRGDDPTST